MAKRRDGLLVHRAALVAGSGRVPRHSLGTLRRDGYISFRGRKYDSPSAAASKATGHAMNGWVSWALSGGAWQVGAAGPP